ncbi:MAG: FmdE family protein [Methanobrevibacter sp.]|jgi:formylmethanofuran dehydrogenase subunit E|nr:FmdE family protein [Candidatus Methanoflexus mossambicus]
MDRELKELIDNGLKLDKDFQEQLEKVAAFHGHICGGIVMGTKMSMIALDMLGFELNKRNKDLLVFVEIGRCATDAVQVVTGCTLGKGTLKLIDYGRFAATFYKISTGEAIRITDEDIKLQETGEIKKETKEELINRLVNTSNNNLFKIQKVKIHLKEEDLPGKREETIICPVCGEMVKDNKHIYQNGKAICKSCAIESYYELLD